MDGKRILYSVCVDDLKMVLKEEKGIDFDSLPEDNQEDIIHIVTKALECGFESWYDSIQTSIENVQQDGTIKEG